jgi:hypothetical protein
MSDVRIDMNTQEVELTLGNGKTMQGEVYLSLYSTNRMGSQTMEEFLCQVDRFVPFKTDEGFMLLNSSQIMMARLPLHKDTNQLAMIGEKHSVAINTTLGETIQAYAYVSLPKGYQRMKDYLNQSPRYFTCYTEEHVLFINLDCIMWVTD